MRAAVSGNIKRIKQSFSGCAKVFGLQDWTVSSHANLRMFMTLTFRFEDMIVMSDRAWKALMR